jgi:hypothetical protein
MTTRLDFAVEQLTAVVNRLQALRTSILGELKATEWLRVVVRDPDSRAVELYQRDNPS